MWWGQAAVVSPVHYGIGLSGGHVVADSHVLWWQGVPAQEGSAGFTSKSDFPCLQKAKSADVDYKTAWF